MTIVNDLVTIVIVIYAYLYCFHFLFSSGLSVHHVLPDKQAQHGPERLLSGGSVRGAEEVRSEGPPLRGQSHPGPVQRGGDDSEATAGAARWQTTDSVHRLHRFYFQSFRGRRRSQVRAELALLDW